MKDVGLKKSLLAAMLTVPMISTVNASDYMADINFVRDDYEQEEFESSTNLIEGSFYFGGVEIGTAAYTEASFLSKASSLSLKTSKTDSDSDITFFGNNFSSDGESDEQGISGRVVIPGSNIILGIGYSSGDGDFKSKRNGVLSSESTTEFDETELTIGWYVTDNSSLQVSLADSEQTSKSKTNPSRGESRTDIRDIDINYRIVPQLSSGSSMSVDVDLYTQNYEYNNTSIEEDYTGLGVAVAFNPMQKLGFGLAVGFETGDIPDADYYSFSRSLFIEYYVTQSVSIGATYNRTDIEIDDNDFGDDFDYDDNLLAFGFSVRI